MDHLTPRETQQYLKDNPEAVFIDCRSEMEYMYVGHPLGAMIVPWYDGADWEKNPHFVGQVKRLAGANFQKRPIVLICRSGNRSIEAGEELERCGFRHVAAVLHGFEGELDPQHHRNTLSGWRVDGLPWEQY
jgi:rhodanese-related sulfurtransferase